MDATKVLEATGNPPRAVVADPCTADKDEANGCAVAETSEQAPKEDGTKDSGEKQAVPASGPADTRKEIFQSSVDNEALVTNMTANNVRQHLHK